MKCPNCKKENVFAMCDDDCGTFICLECDIYFYYTYINNVWVYVLEHDPLCNNKY